MADTLSPIARLLHRRSENLRKGDPVALPIVASTTFHLPGDPQASHVYGRYGNPTVEEVEAEIGLLEGAEALLFPSGMAAIAALAYAHLKPGDRVLVHADGYYNTRALLETQFAPMGVRVETCPTAQMAEADLTGVKLVLAETPSNPGLEVCDIARLAGRAKAAGALLAVDNTTATPLCQSPLELGADFTIIADTKAMAGHSDILAGHVASRDPALMEPVRTWRRLAGAICSPFDAWLLHRGLATLELRVARANANALALAHALSAYPGVSGVRYPGLPTDPSYAVACLQMTGFGPIVSFCLPDRAMAERFIEIHPLLAAATSFGGVHASAECRVRWGDNVPDGFIRLACGIEPVAEFTAVTVKALDSLALPAR
ncbi:MAG: cystathionine gamma-lyase [Hyphomonas sp.]